MDQLHTHDGGGGRGGGGGGGEGGRGGGERELESMVDSMRGGKQGRVEQHERVVIGRGLAGWVPF